MKANVTLKIDTELLREVRILAAEEDSSFSALLAGKLAELVQEGRGFQQTRERAKARLRTGYDLGWKPPLSRDEIYEW